MPTESTDSGVSRQLHETYLKAKRYLVFFSGVLLLSLVAGIDPKADASVLPLQIARPEYWSVALGALVLYYMSQLVIFWAAQTEPVRSVRPHVIDYWMSVAIGLASLASVLAVQFVPLVPPLISALSNVFSGAPLGLTWDLILGLAGFLVSTFAVVVTYFSVISVRRQIRKDAAKEGVEVATLADVLTSHLWELVFNPVTYSQTSGRRGSKHMVLEPEGVIREGNNSNEATWRLNGRFLEFLDSTGAVFSRFKSNADMTRLDHTNDSDTRSIKSQYMLRKTRFTFEPDEKLPAS